MNKSGKCKTTLLIVLIGFSLCSSVSIVAAEPVIINHTCTNITQIPQSVIERAKDVLHIAYGHTSHGSQLTDGMTGLVDFANNGGLGLNLPDNIFQWNQGGTGGALDLHDYAMAGDAGYYPQWVNNTRTYLGAPNPITGRGTNPDHPDTNVIIWSWCGQVGDKYVAGTLYSEYLTPMTQLETDYPGVFFVYMTGHVDIGTDQNNVDYLVDANNKAANQAIRDFCTANDKILYDFADIERYDPDGTYYEFVHDDCDYYSSVGGTFLGNWAIEWQNSHTQGVDWYTCSSAHTQPLNANRKAYAAWWLWARLGGWNPSAVNHAPVLQPIGNKCLTYGQLLQFTIKATDPDSADILTFSATGLPSGAQFDTATHTFTWTPTIDDVGAHPVTFVVKDNGSPQGSDQKTITISVNDGASGCFAPSMGGILLLLLE